MRVLLQFVWCTVVSSLVGGPVDTIRQWQDGLVAGGKPIMRSSPAEAASLLKSKGYARLGKIFKPEQASKLKQHIFDLIDSGGGEHAGKDLSNVPGTRLRFLEAVDVSFASQRSDVLLPLRDPIIADALAVAASALKPIMEEAVHQLGCLPHIQPSGSNARTPAGLDQDLEIVELASLVSRCGGQHQNVHADFRRFRDGDDTCEADLKEQMGKLPPRLVCFVYLQDVPTSQHGPTAFLPGTNTVQAHNLLYSQVDGKVGASAPSVRDALCGMATRNTASPLSSSSSLSSDDAACELATCLAGECVVYDASVLHFGTANSVPENNRAIFYFGVGRQGAAAALAGPEAKQLKGFTEAQPVLLREVVDASSYR